jgi:hypothetical protein
MTTEAETEDKARALQCIENAKAAFWSSVEKFDGTQLIVGDDYGFMCLKAETVVGDRRKAVEFDAVPYREVDAALAEVLVLAAADWVSEQHRA